MKDYSWRSLTVEERVKALLKIQSIDEFDRYQSRAKAILTYFVKDNMCASAISRLHDPRIVCFSNRNYYKPLSTTSILRIIYQYFPEFEGKQLKQKVSDKRRAELIRKREKEVSPHIKQCAFCGSTEGLEEHHMIPLFMGGTNDDRNLIHLCHRCHKDVSKYQYLLRKGKINETE